VSVWKPDAVDFRSDDLLLVAWFLFLAGNVTSPAGDSRSADRNTG